ncbi:MAG: hypothetical protein ABR592_13090, partial [Nitriliruptorales bacterium]
MKKILAIMALALSLFFGGSAAADPEVEVRPVDENACEQTDPMWADAPGPARPGLPHDQAHGDPNFGCHHATGTED